MHLNPGLVIGGIPEKLLYNRPAAVDGVCLLPGVGARVIAGWPVVERQADRFRAAWDCH